VSVARASASTSSTSTVAEALVNDDLVVVGRIGPPRGVRGELFVEPLTDAPQDRFAPGTVLRTGSASTLTVEASSMASGKLVVHFAGVDSRESAEALRGTELVIPAGERPALDDPDEFYDTDLVGLEARGVDGAVIGRVADVVHAAGASYLVVDVDGRDRLVPFVGAIVPTVDVPGGFVVIDPPEGLFDL
jgi:16S rRNA processing protein RimM